MPRFFSGALQDQLEMVLVQKTRFRPIPQPREHQVRCTGIVTNHSNRRLQRGGQWNGLRHGLAIALLGRAPTRR